MCIKTPHSRKNCTCYVLFDVVSNKSGGILMETSPLSISVCHPAVRQAGRGRMNSQKSRLCSFQAHNHKSAPDRSGVFMREVRTRPSTSKCEHVALLLLHAASRQQVQKQSSSPLVGSTNDRIALNRTD